MIGGEEALGLVWVTFGPQPAGVPAPSVSSRLPISCSTKNDSDLVGIGMGGLPSHGPLSDPSLFSPPLSCAVLLRMIHNLKSTNASYRATA